MESLFRKKSAQINQHVHGILCAILTVIFMSHFSFMHHASQSTSRHGQCAL